MAEKINKGRTAFDPPRFLPLIEGVSFEDARETVAQLDLSPPATVMKERLRFFETQNGALYRRGNARWSKEDVADAGYYKGRKLLVWLDLEIELYRYTSETAQAVLASVSASSPFAFNKTANFTLLGYSPRDEWPQKLKDICRHEPPSLFETARTQLGLPVPGAPVLDEFRPEANENLLDISRKVIGRQAYRMEANAAGAILEADPEFIHDVRVATRRARFALRMMRPFFGDDCKKLRKELKWIADVLGEVRDCDVMKEGLREPLRRTENLLSGQERFEARLDSLRAPAQKELEQSLHSERFRKLIEDLYELYRSPAPKLPSEKRPTRKYASKLILKASKKVRKSLSKLDGPPAAEQLHRVRIEVKRLRYTCEYFKVLYAGKLRDTIKSCKLVQDSLGEHQDAAVAISVLKEIARELSKDKENAQAVMVTGALVEMQRRKMLERRKLALPLLKDFSARIEKLERLL